MKNQEINMQAGEMLRRLDSTTYNHSVRVMMISAEVEEYLNLTDHKLMCAALFHDIGKAYVPFDILDKKERLTGLERELVDLHSYFGYCMLNSIKVEEDICRIVLYHHGFRPLTIRDLGHYDNNNVYGIGPNGSPPRRKDNDFQRTAIFIPYSVVVGSDNLKVISSRIQVGEHYISLLTNESPLAIIIF